MNVELAQIIALIAYGNEYLSSPRTGALELFPSHSTFQHISQISFQKEKTLHEAMEWSWILARDTQTWFSHLERDGIKCLKLDLLNLQYLPPPYATSIFTAGGAWVIQTDQGKCWKAKWAFTHQRSRQARIWKIEYWESDNLPVIKDFPDIETASRDLENSLEEAQNFSARRKFSWETWFADAIKLLHNPFPIQPFYADLLPYTFGNVRVRQLLAGALKAWVFGGLGSWNDMYIIDPSLEKEYQRISKNLYGAVIQSVGAVTNSTADDRLRELSICEIKIITANPKTHRTIRSVDVSIAPHCAHTPCHSLFMGKYIFI